MEYEYVFIYARFSQFHFKIKARALAQTHATTSLSFTHICDFFGYTRRIESFWFLDITLFCIPYRKTRQTIVENR